VVDAASAIVKAATRGSISGGFTKAVCNGRSDSVNSSSIGAVKKPKTDPATMGGATSIEV
jgi:hypothetical protein